MTVTNGYITRDELKAATSGGISGSTFDADIDRAINAACRAIDEWCDRRFWQDANAVERFYTAGDSGMCVTDDISELTALVVKTDPGNDGTYESTWTRGTDFRALPINAVADGEPFTHLERLIGGSYAFPTSDYRVSVTAKFGWVAVPDPIKQAALTLAQRYFQRRTAPFGVAGNSEQGVVRISRQDVDVVGLIGPYKRIRRPGRQRTLA